MPGSKKRKLGSGRPKGEYSQKSTPEKQAYHGAACDRSEGRKPRVETPQARRAGCPSLGEAALTPNSKLKRDTELRSSKKKAKKLSETRRAAANQRWHTPESRKSDGDIDESDMGQPLSDTEDKAEVEEDEAVESHESSENKMTTIRRKARLLAKIPPNNIQHLDIFIAMLH